MTRAPTAALLAALTLAAACEGEPAHPPAAEPGPDAVADRAQPPLPPAAPTPAPPPPGPALVASDAGVARLTEGAFTLIAGTPKQVNHLLRGADGVVWMATSKGVWSLTGDQTKLIPAPSTPNAIDGIALDGQGRLWVAGFRGYAIWDGTRWETHKASEVAAAEDDLTDLLHDRTGNTWMLGRHGIYLKTADGWAPQDIGGEAIEFFNELEEAPDGTLYAMHNRGVFRRGSDGWMALPLSGALRDGETLRAGGDGRIYSAGNSDKIDVLTGELVEQIALKGETFNVFDVLSLAVDERGRVWVGAEDGLVVRDGSTETQIPSVSVQALGKQLTAILVDRGGPALPSAVPVVRGKVKGRLLQGGEPVAELDGELCPSSKFMFNTSPCESHPDRKAFKTDAQGGFTVEGVAFGTQNLLVNKAGKWTQILGAMCCTELTEGGTQDLGDINLSD